MATTVNSRHTEPNGGTLGPRKTLIIMVTVVGCIAILWPKVFYPMMVGPTQTKTVIKDHRGSGCCDVVLDQEETFANMSINVPNQQNLFRKRNIGPTVEDHSIRQERPPHLRPETIHPAMRERGRAIPHVGSTHSERPQSPPRIVEGRPGPIPGMRPPMGAGSHQSTKSANSMGFIMPLYTIGIVSFFIYTILKLIFKKTPATPYPEIKPDTTFRNEVFTAPDQPYMKRPDSGTTKLVEGTQKDAAQHDTSSNEPITSSFSTTSTSLEQSPEAISIGISSSSSRATIIDQETEETDNTEADEKVPEQNGHVCKPVDSTETVESEPEQQVVEKHEELEHDENDETAQHQSEAEEDIPKIEQRHDTGAVPKKRETSEDRSSLKVIPMEKKVAYEPGQHSSRPGTPAQFVTLDPTIIEAEAAESKCILLDAAKVPQSSKVTIPESELALETIDASQKSSEETPFDLNLVVVFESLSNLNQGRSLEVNVLLGSEPTTTVVQPSPAARVASPTREVVLSGMMKLSLVKLDDNEKNAAGDVVLKAKDVKKGDTYDGTFGPNEE
ncbi:uncharacterized protein LOC5564765 isoform X4 [Aedes aegypti]|uniref:Resistance to inhibitors of cholinesterase protein 3 N-terminal domain-containing protein n=1 Tax=Aedes aegypti TaxID=7159 RepID=A0A6I8U7A6_AEDAE|nr:uncharacterized protein LOC5564765 isoform X4 [Aedes aegypti]